MDKKDLKILSYLRKDSRMPLTKMSRHAKIPVSTIFDRIRINERNMIVRHTSLLNFNQLGFHARSNIILKVDRDDKENLKQYLMKHASVNSVCKVNNGYDFMVEGVFKQIKDMEDFIEDVESKFKIPEKMTFFIIEDLKRESFMADPDMLFFNN